jgi:hypothetical protein
MRSSQVRLPYPAGRLRRRSPPRVDHDGNSPEVQSRSYREVTTEDMQRVVAKARIRIPREGTVVPFDRAAVDR